MARSGISAKIKEEVLTRAEGKCEYCLCLAKNAIHTFHVDHILPLSKGGTSDMDNLALACGGCNLRKASQSQAYDPQTNESCSLFHPRKDKWTAHFQWSEDRLKIIGTTPRGRATVQALSLNRAGVTNLRRLALLAEKMDNNQE